MRHLLVAAIGLLLSLFAGCPSPSDTSGPGPCQKLHDQCTIREGLLGVCNAKPCPPGQTAPCFECVSQH